MTRMCRIHKAFVYTSTELVSDHLTTRSDRYSHSNFFQVFHLFLYFIFSFVLKNAISQRVCDNICIFCNMSSSWPSYRTISSELLYLLFFLSIIGSTKKMLEVFF